MVNRRLPLIALSVIFIFAMLASVASAQERVYYIDHQWVKIWINENRSIDLFYNITLRLDSGKNINFVYVGQPVRDFTIGEAKDQYGNSLVATDASSGDNYRANVSLSTPLEAGQTIWFTLITNVAGMVVPDEKNPGNDGMLFIPVWWPVPVSDLRISIVLPPNVTQEMVKTTEVFWNNTSVEDGRLVVYWQKDSLVPDMQYPVGISFPEGYVQKYEPPSGALVFLQRYWPAFLIIGMFVVIVGIGVVAVRKRPYLTPKVSMETLGISRGLTAVEASYLLDMKPTQLVTEMLYSLLQKRAVWVESTNPALKLKIMPSFQKKTGTEETQLRYYEIDFLDAIKNDGTLDEEKLAKTVMFLRDTVEQKLRGYCRRDTVDYYRKIAAKAWEQVEQAGTPELASKAYDEQLLWLLLDPNYQSRTQTAFRDRAFEPSPFWFWYWYSYQHYHPNPTYKPNVETPAQSAKPPTVPGADFANNIATAVEKTSNNIVANLEKFANAILPAPAAKASSEPARHDASCVCACAACACACACVSCACACAGGGVG